MNASGSPPAPPARGGRSLLVWGISLSAVLLLALGLIAWRYRLRSDPGCIEYPMLRASDIPTAVAAAPDGAVWFTIELSDAIGRWRHDKIERLAKGTQNLEPIGLAVAADGSAWYTDATARAIARMLPGVRHTPRARSCRNCVAKAAKRPASSASRISCIRCR